MNCNFKHLHLVFVDNLLKAHLNFKKREKFRRLKSFAVCEKNSYTSYCLLQYFGQFICLWATLEMLFVCGPH